MCLATSNNLLLMLYDAPKQIVPWNCDLVSQKITQTFFSDPPSRMCLATSNNLLLMLYDAPKQIFPWNCDFLVSQKITQTFFSDPPSPLICTTATVVVFVLLRTSRFNFHCYTQREATPTQKLAQKWCYNLSHERLQRAFTRANQLQWTAQQKTLPSVTASTSGRLKQGSQICRKKLLNAK